MSYIVYGKKRTGKKFKPFDAKKNQFVVNLIHASIFPESELPKLEKEVTFMNENNPEYIFEIRKTN